MSTANPTAVSYAGQFSNQTLPIVAFASALRAYTLKMGITRWCAVKDAGGVSGPGAQVPIPFVGRIGNQDISPGQTVGAVTALANNTRYLVLNKWRESKPFALTGLELDNFQLNTLVPRALQRAVQSVGEYVETQVVANAYAFPAIYGTASTTSQFASNLNAIPALRGAMSLNLCPNTEDVALFLRSSDITAMRQTDAFQKNPQLAGLARAEAQYGKAIIGEFGSMKVFENQFITSRLPGTYTSSVLTMGVAGAIGDLSLTIAATTASSTVKKGDAFKAPSSEAPEGYVFFAAAEDKTLTAGASTAMKITQPLEFAITIGAAVTPLTTDTLGVSSYENLAITPDALLIGNRFLRCGDLAEKTGCAWDIMDDSDPERDYIGTGLGFTLKNFATQYQSSWHVSCYFDTTWLDTRLGGRLQSGGVAI